MQKIFKKSSLLSRSTNRLCFALFLFILSLSVNVNGFLFAQVQQLPAPTISVENPVFVNTSQLSLSWDILDEKTKYAFELCTDTACTQKVKSYSNLSYPGLTISKLENGQYFWRVSGVDENKNLGLFSTPQPLLVDISQIKDESISANGKQETLIENINEKAVVKTLNKDFQTRILNLPWYIYLIIFAYIVYIVKTLLWYINK